MKKFSFVFLIFFALISFGCNKSNIATTNQTENETVSTKEIKTEKKEEKILTTKDAIALYPGTPLYKENKDGKMVYADEVAKGESLSVYYNDNGVESKNAIRLLSNGKEDSFDFIRVSSQFTDEDTEYWTRALFVAQEHPIANVIVQEGHIYNTAQIFDATSKKLSIGDIVALKSEINFDSEFTPVTIYDGTEDGKEIFVKTEILSTYKDDLIAVQTFDSIKAFEAIKPEISYELMEIMVSSLDLSSAISYYINPSITEEKNGEE